MAEIPLPASGGCARPFPRECPCYSACVALALSQPRNFLVTRIGYSQRALQEDDCIASIATAEFLERRREVRTQLLCDGRGAQITLQITKPPRRFVSDLLCFLHGHRAAPRALI